VLDGLGDSVERVRQGGAARRLGGRDDSLPRVLRGTGAAVFDGDARAADERQHHDTRDGEPERVRANDRWTRKYK
jgi:hypothetical protein